MRQMNKNVVSNGSPDINDNTGQDSTSNTLETENNRGNLHFYLFFFKKFSS
jgi:hypothetical protein